MNVYDLTVSVRVRCQARHLGFAEEVVYEGLQTVVTDWVEKLRDGLPDDADKPLVLEEMVALNSERVVTGVFWRDGALVT